VNHSLIHGLNESGELTPLSRNCSTFGRLLQRVDVEHRSLVIEKRGTPTAVLLNIRDYVKLAAPEPEVLKIIGNESRRNRTSALSSRQIDEVVKRARADKKKR
jgi:prevent-host-death family protein